MKLRTVAVESRCLLRSGGGYMEVHKDNKDTADRSRVFIEEINTLIIDSSQVTITSALLQELSEAGVSVILTDSRHMPLAMLVNLNSNYSNKPLRAQIAWTEENKAAVWQSIVRQKLINQGQLLQAFGLPRGEMLFEYAAETEPGDVTMREGHGAKVYFNTLFGNDFVRGHDDGINSALNYAYSLILSAAAVCLTDAGYILPLGINHRSQFNSFNLACDLMEPFRPLADMAAKQLLPERLDTETKHRLAGILSWQVRLGGRVYRAGDAIELYCRRVTAAAETGKIELIPEADIFADGLVDMHAMTLC